MKHELLRSRNLRVVSIVNQKGGVGKTSSVISLSSGLALAGQKVLVVDGDPQGNLSIFFSEPIEYGDIPENDLEGLLKEMESVPEVQDPERYIIPEVRENLDILPLYHRSLRSDIKEDTINLMTPAFSEMMKKMKKQYDWILIDCSPSNGQLEKMMISASETVLVPLEFQMFSVSGLNGLLDEIQECGSRVGKHILVEALLFTKTEGRLNRIKEYREIFGTFEIPIYEICKSEVLPKSIEVKKTIWEADPSNNVCKDYFTVIENSFIG